MTLNKLQALLKLLLAENKFLSKSIEQSATNEEFKTSIKQRVSEYSKSRPHLIDCCKTGELSRSNFKKLNWKDAAALRMLDYIEYAGIRVQDPSISKKEVISDPFGQLYKALKEKDYELRVDFVMDMIMLFRQFNGKLKKSVPNKAKVMEWIDRHPSGLDPEIVALRNENRDRIIRIFIEMMDAGRIKDAKFFFEPGMSKHDKYSLMLKWSQTRLYQLRFAIRDPDVLIEMLHNSISEKKFEY
jgi:lysine 2,3-aminomutase